MPRDYSEVFAIVKQLNINGARTTYKDLLKEFMNGVTDSLRAISDDDLDLFKKSLRLMVGEKHKYTDSNDAIRKAIISQFKSVGGSTTDAIAWAEKYGVFGVKKKFNDYDGQELWQMLRNAEKMKGDAIKSVNRQMQ